MTSSLRTLLSGTSLKSGALALGGMIVGAVVGIVVQAGVESTGMLGPSVESLLAEQESNFEDVNARLDTLRTSTSDPEMRRELNQLAELIKKQDALRQQAGTELAYLTDQVASMKQDSLAERGFAGGADFWLKAGESVSVGDDKHVLGLTRVWGAAVDVILNGEKKRMAVGDVISTNDCNVFFKQLVKREDGRVGFDVSCG